MEALQVLLKYGYTKLEDEVMQDLVNKGFVGHLIQVTKGKYKSYPNTK